MVKLNQMVQMVQIVYMIQMTQMIKFRGVHIRSLCLKEDYNILGEWEKHHQYGKRCEASTPVEG